MSFRCFVFALVLMSAVSLALPLPGADGQAGSAAGQMGSDAARCIHIDGALLEHAKDGFKALKPGDKIAAQTVVIGLPKAELVSASGTVKVELQLYLGDTLPVTEAAVLFDEAKGVDADITLRRGVISIQPQNAKGDVVVRLRGGDESWELRFKVAGSSVLVARFGRLEPGTRQFSRDPKKVFSDDPLMHLGILVTKGKVDLTTASHHYILTAPPGPALMAWDSGAGEEIKRLEQLPDEVKKLQPADDKAYKDATAVIAKLVTGDIGKGLDQLVDDNTVSRRRVAVACMGALDDLPRLWAALENAKHVDVRDQAVLTLRNWAGRRPGQLAKLKEYLTKEKKFKEVQARNVVQLLKGFDEQDRHEPAVYQLLIDALDLAPLPIRQLANWHLERLAPAGQRIAFDAAADEAARHQAAEKWRRLIPPGQLPPAPKKDEVKKGG